MKNAIISGFIFTLVISLPILGSEKNWLQSTISTFTENMLTRHTYEYDSFKHKRDRAFLYLLPSYISQAVLLKQRRNMQHFLKQNEEDALEGVAKHLNITPETFLKIKKEIKDACEFNLNAMKESHDVFHDPSLPTGWYRAISYACNKHGINKKSIHLTMNDIPENYLANATNLAPSREILWNSYNPATVNLKMEEWKATQEKFNQENLGSLEDNAILLQSLAAHELTHVRHGHFIKRNFHTIVNLNLGQEEIKSYMKSLDFLQLVAAQEKTADTFLACTDPEISKNSVYGNVRSIYPANLNDARGIHANWQTSQAIANFQQFKSFAKQKINEFPQSLRTISKA